VVVVSHDCEVKVSPEREQGVDILRRSRAAATLDEIRGRVAAADGPAADEALQIARDELARARQV
jgi:hypothetical protein